MNPIFGIALVIIWLYILHVLSKTKLKAWCYLWGSLGLFILLMIYVQPICTEPLARCVTAAAGFVGRITGAFESYFKYGIIYVASNDSSITLKVDMECSGIIEIMAFECLLIFYEVYSIPQRIIVGFMGFIYITLCDAFRIIVICYSVHFFGIDAYYIVHTFVGRIIFYALSVWLYFYVFTKPQIVKMKVGNFSYGVDKKNT